MAPIVPVEFSGLRESKRGFVQMMGKARKVSRGQSMGSVSDYRNSVEEITDSEGFGSCGRVESEVIASEDSCATVRERISLPGDNHGCFGVPFQLISLSKMSHQERIQLEMRLKGELEHVKILQRRIASASTSFSAFLPSSGAQGFGAGQRNTTWQNSGMYRDLPAHHVKRRAPPGRRGKNSVSARGNHLKRPQHPTIDMLMKQCENLLKKLMDHQFGFVFREPVDIVELSIPDYFDIIKHPMDLGTVKKKLTSGQYKDPWGFADDVRLTFTNAVTYNPPDNNVHIMAQALRKLFEARWKMIEKKVSAITYTPVPSKSSVVIESEIDTPTPPSKRVKIQAVEKERPTKQVMSSYEKHKVTEDLQALADELPENITEFLRKSCFDGNQTTEDEIEIDVDALNDDSLFTLRKLLDDYIMQKQNRVIAETHERKVHKDPRLSQTPDRPSKANEPIDEDVDIGENDLPASSFPPVQIEKDNPVKVRECSGSSSSSSESGSSSSESDSDSSSDSESDRAKASAGKNNMETLASGGNVEQQNIDCGGPDADNRSLNGSSQIEQKSRSNPASVEVDGHQEGESAMSERQISPETLYRRAQLKNRFADTILRAQEITLGKNESKDPEKLRLEKEELERRRKEEKARLQAEAKAAEEVRRKAEAEAAAAAAAEAKRKIELEREAARQALLKMERAVEINENGHFLEDLEMLGVAPSKTLPSFANNTSPDRAQDGLESFNFQGSSYALQQLGLFMKKDDEDEEELAEPPSVPAVTDDPEDGEID